jgi:hypothetical protein
MTMAAHFLDDLKRREHAVALATHAVNGTLGRSVGDPVHEEVTEGRRRQWEVALRAGAAWARSMSAGYYSCGDLAAWMLWRLGCRDESLVNRTNDGGVRAWVPGRNLTVIASSRAFTAGRPPTVPQPGDILFLNQNGGHVCVLLEWDAASGLCITADYGQPYGRRRSRRIGQRAGAWTLDGVTLRGWLDLDGVRFTAPVNLDGVA